MNGKTTQPSPCFFFFLFFLLKKRIKDEKEGVRKVFVGQTSKIFCRRMWNSGTMIEEGRVQGESEGTEESEESRGGLLGLVLGFAESE